MFLTIAAILLLIVILVQNVLYPPLRSETISDGLFGPYHWYLDGAYVILATALSLAFWNTTIISEILSIAAAVALMVTAFTNTFSAVVDKIKPELHVKLHTQFTIVMFLSMLSLEIVNNHGWMTWLTVAGVAVPAAAAGILTLLKSKVAGPVAEKLAVFLMCTWLVAHSI